MTSSGLLYSYQDKTDYEGDAPPLRSYVLNRFILKDLYVADNMTRYVVHLIQKNGGNRQIILYVLLPAFASKPPLSDIMFAGQRSPRSAWRRG